MKRMKHLLSAVMLLTVITGCAVDSKTAQVALTAQPSPAGDSVATSENGNEQLEWAFTKAGQHPEKMLIDVIKTADSTLDIAIYSLTHPDIVQAIKDAKKRGVAVRIITDKQQSSGKSQKEALKILGSADIPIKINTHSGLMHLKVTIADKKIATTGSFNYSKAASTTNDEVLMVVHDEKVAKSFADQFEAMWNDTKDFTSITPKIAQPTDQKPSPSPSSNLADNGNVTFKNCTEVKAAGKAPLHKDEPGYSTKLDRDGDGIACEK